MDDEVETALDEAAHCLVATRGPIGPAVARVGFWSDGAGVWFAAPPDSREVAALRASPRCLVYLLRADGRDLSCEGLARLYEPDDPVTLAAHAPTIAAALAALAVKHSAELLARARALLANPPTALPALPAVVRIPLERAAFEEPAAPDAGIAPALPTVVPPAVRRALAGQRRIALATQDAGDRPPHLGPAAWAAGLGLAPPGWRQLAAGQRAVAVAQSDPGRDSAAVLLEGAVDDGGALRAERAHWWLGLAQGEAPVDERASQVDLPD